MDVPWRLSDVDHWRAVYVLLYRRIEQAFRDREEVGGQEVRNRDSVGKSEGGLSEEELGWGLSDDGMSTGSHVV